jgi:hypothetical protein
LAVAEPGSGSAGIDPCCTIMSKVRWQFHPTAMFARFITHRSCLPERSNFELTVRFFVDTQAGERTGRYNRRKQADQVSGE